MRQSRFAIRAAALASALVAFVYCTPIDSPNIRPADNGEITRANDVTINADPVIVAAGDIVCGNNTPAGTACKHAQTASLIGTINPNAVLVLGDNQYEDGTLAEYNALYGPTWGQYKSITYPSVGNHEYQTANASGYFDYFNGVGVQTGRAGDRSKGYYSYDLGAWHLIALNSNCGNVGGCGVGSAQEVWLKADLAAHPNACTAAYWHHPRFSSGQHSNDASTQALWDALYNAKADLILTGHDHNYERFAPMTATGVLDNTNGIRSFVVGTGGKEQRSLGTTKANSVVRSNNSLGVLKVTLHPTSYDWQFVSIAGGTLNDAGSSTCVGVPQSNQPPVAAITSPSNGSSFVQGASVAFAGTGTDPENGSLSGSALVWTSNIDGAIGTGVSFAKTNLSVGVHTITLTVSDANGATASTVRTVTITAAPPGNTAPVAAYTYSCVPKNSAYECTFDATGSTDDVGIVSYRWTWSNGRDETRPNAVVKNNPVQAGTYTVTLKVTDAGGLSNSTSQQVIVGAAPVNQPPTANITAPTNGASFVQGATVSFSGSGSDPEDGTLSGSSLAWSSSIDGAIGSGTSFSKTNLSLGTHTITLTVTDSKGASASTTRSITITAPVNQPPTAAISAPTNGASFVQGATVSFSGSGSDPEDGALSGASLAWSSNIDGAIGSGTSFNKTNLSLGTHTITLTATDSKGAPASATRSITITAPVNQPPTAAISAPTNGASFVQGATVSFSGSGSDPEDGTLSGASLAWSSNIDGAIGSGTSFSKTNLSLGTHTITLTVTDSKGASTSTTRSITITAPPTGNQPPVADYSYSCTPQTGSGYRCTFNASTSTDDNGIVSWVWKWNTGRGETRPSAIVTNTNIAAGTYQITLTVIDAGGLQNSITKTVVVP